MNKTSFEKLNHQERQKVIRALDFYKVPSKVKSALLNGPDQRVLYQAFCDGDVFEGKAYGLPVIIHFFDFVHKDKQVNQVKPVSRVVDQSESLPVVEKRKGRGKAKNPSKKVTSVPFDPDVLQALNELAEIEERSVSSLIRLAVNDYLKKKRIENAK
jgi:hypothetical protein